MTKAKQKFSVIFMAIFAALFVFSIFTTSNSFAAANIFRIKNVEITERSDTVEGDIGAFDETSIGSYFTFHKVGDKVVYKITLENTDTNTHVIATISDNNNSNENLEYSYDAYENTTVAAGESFDFILTATYKNGVTDIDLRNQIQSLKLSISFADTQDSDEFDLAVPNTGENTVNMAGGMAVSNIVFLAVSAAGLVVCSILIIMKHKNAAKYLGAVVAAVSVTALVFSVKAATLNTNEISIDTELGFYDKVVITNGNDQIITDYGTKFEDIEGITAPVVDNQNLSGWKDESDNPIDTTQPVMSDLTITPVYERIAFNVTMDANGKNYSDGSKKYVLKYNSSDTTHEGNTRSKKIVSHSANVNDKGEQNSTYNNNLATSDVVTMPGASKLKVTLRYRTESSYDYVYTIKGEYSGVIGGRSPSTYVGKVSGGSGDYSTREYEIDGDTVTFGFYTDSSGLAYYGYYAVVEGYDSDGNLICDPEYDRELLSGAYMEPAIENFYGWSEDPDAENADYTSEDEIKKFLEGTNGVNKTLYAVLRKRYSVTYDGNGATAGTMESVHHENLRADEPFFGYAANYLRDGYGFVGWSSDKNATPDNGAKIFGPSQAITPAEIRDGNLDENLNIVLYAVWVKNDDTYNLQNFDNAAFEAAHPNQTVTALEDTRDGQIYAVAKLADNKWWIIENLRFDPAGKTLTSENTNNPTAAFANTAKNRATSTFLNCWTDTSGYEGCYNQYSIDVSNITATTPNVSASGGYQWYSYGVYYNWYSATAGNGTIGLAPATSANGDICPAGWRLPKADWRSNANSMTVDDSEFSILSVANGGDPMFAYDKDQALVLMNYPNNFIRSGRSQPGGRTGDPVVIGAMRNDIGQYWSATKDANSSSGWINYLTAFFYNGSRSVSQGSTSMDVGYTLRCLKK